MMQRCEHIMTESMVEGRQSMVQKLWTMDYRLWTIPARLCMLTGLVLALLLPLCQSVQAQQDPKFNQYMFNPLGINPAYAGSREVLSAVTLFRKQWLGFEGSPTITTFSIHGPLVKRKMGLGFQVTNDMIGPRSTTSAEVDYAYRFRALRGKLSLGLGLGIQYMTFDWNKISYKDQVDLIPNYGVDKLWVPDADFGVWYNTNKFYTGLELAHLTQPRLDISDSSITGANAYRQFRHLSFTMGRAFVLNETLTLKTSVLYKQAGLYRGMVDINASVLINNRLWAGVTARPDYGGVLIFEYIVNNKFRMGYSFDYPLNQFRTIQQGTSHELFIGYDFGVSRSATVSPRYF